MIVYLDVETRHQRVAATALTSDEPDRRLFDMPPAPVRPRDGSPTREP
jgi:hypothetical protein